MNLFKRFLYCKYYELWGDEYHFETSCNANYMFCPTKEVKGKCPICNRTIKVITHLNARIK